MSYPNPYPNTGFETNSCVVNGGEKFGVQFNAGTTSVQICQVVIYGFDVDDNDPLSPPMTFQVKFFADPIPSAALYEADGVAPTSVVDTGIQVAIGQIFDIYSFTLNINPPATVPPGLVWLEIMQDNCSTPSNYFAVSVYNTVEGNAPPFALATNGQDIGDDIQTNISVGLEVYGAGFP